MRIATALIVVLLGIAPAAAEQMTLYSAATDDHSIEFGREGGIGNETLWDSPLEDEAGNRVGTNAGHCIQVDREGARLCTIVFDHRDHGQITMTGVQRPEPEPSILTITGGTGRYEGITGTSRSTPVEDRARFEHELDYRID